MWQWCVDVIIQRGRPDAALAKAVNIGASTCTAVAHAHAKLAKRLLNTLWRPISVLGNLLGCNASPTCVACCHRTVWLNTT